MAFQMRDDLLGVFGDPAVTGKPAGNDLRRGKETVVLARARKSPPAWSAVERVLGRADATDAEVADAVAALDRAGIREVLEADLAAHLAWARVALATADLRPEGIAALESLAGLLVLRAA
jgi:geranylgeranyl diphosphate synthase type I